MNIPFQHIHKKVCVMSMRLGDLSPGVKSTISTMPQTRGKIFLGHQTRHSYPEIWRCLQTPLNKIALPNAPNNSNTGLFIFGSFQIEDCPWHMCVSWRDDAIAYS